tara:strand:+ start:2723 stop:3109 length:387 start_codon:yes stop_codon:yes gene_type:complete
MIKITKVVDDKTATETCPDVMYRIEDRINDNRDGCQQVIVLTRDELGQLHHLIDVQFMSEDPNFEESMQPLNERGIDILIEEDDEIEENEVLDTPSIADMLDKQARDRKQEEINNEMAYDDHKNKWST